MEYVTAAMALISGAAQIFGGSSAAKSAGKMARDQARAEQTLTQAKVKGLEEEERHLRGETIAGAAGSGVTASKGSPLDILAEQARTFGDEILTVKQAGTTRAGLAQTRGRMVGQSALYQGIAGGASSASQAFSIFA